jgi:hypothetical protein
MTKHGSKRKNKQSASLVIYPTILDFMVLIKMWSYQHTYLSHKQVIERVIFILWFTIHGFKVDIPSLY